MKRVLPFCTAVLVLLSASSAAADERVYVNGRKVLGLHYSGEAYRVTGGALTGGGVPNAVFTDDHVLEGDFTLPKREGTAAAIILGDSHFGFDGGGKTLYTEGALFGGKVSTLGSADGWIQGGEPFEIVAQRVGSELTIRIDGRVAHEYTVGSGILGRVGLRPHRAVMRIHSFSVNGTLGTPPKAGASETLKIQPAINSAIERGVEYLLAHTFRDGSCANNDQKFPGGSAALVTYTLLKCGLKPEHPAVRQGLAYISQFEPHEVYTVGFTILAYAATGDDAYQEEIERLTGALLDWQTDGIWGYPWGYSTTDGWLDWVDRSDLSNTQIAALALRAASLAGVKVPSGVWKEISAGTLQWALPGDSVLLQKDVGTTRRTAVAGFGYKAPIGATGSMTACGVATLAVCQEALGGKSAGKAARAADGAIRAGVAWLGQNFAVSGNPGKGSSWVCYYLYGLERVGSLLDIEFMGEHNWYYEGAVNLIKRQSAWGSWKDGDPAVDSCFALLFLERATALVTASGQRTKPKNSHVAESPGYEVKLRGTGENPLVVWVSGFSTDVLSEFGEEGRGPRIVAVEYLVDDEVVTRVVADPSRPWSGERFPAQIPFDTRGQKHVSARVQVLPSKTVDPIGAEGETLEGPGFTFHVENAYEAWMPAAALRFSQSSLRTMPRAVEASSVFGSAFAPEKATDGFESTGWLCKAGDTQRVLRIRLSRGTVRADTIVLGGIGSTLHLANRFDVILAASVSINGKEPRRIAFPPDPRQPALLELKRPERIRSLEIQILETLPGTDYPGCAGFSEVSLVLR